MYMIKDDLKDGQKQVILSLSEAKDAVAILPTGFGKSLIYQLFSSVRQQQMKDNVVVLIAS